MAMLVAMSLQVVEVAEMALQVVNSLGFLLCWSCMLSQCLQSQESSGAEQAMLDMNDASCSTHTSSRQ